MLGKHDQCSKIRRRLPHEPGVVQVKLNVSLIAEVKKYGTWRAIVLRLPVVATHEVALLEGIRDPTLMLALWRDVVYELKAFRV